MTIRFFLSTAVPSAAGEAEDYYAEVALATLPRDRWGALGLVPGASEGSDWSAPVTLPAGGCQIQLNADGPSGLSVEVADERFNLLPEFSGDRRGIAGKSKGLNVLVRWRRAGADFLVRLAR